MAAMPPTLPELKLKYKHFKHAKLELEAPIVRSIKLLENRDDSNEPL